ncbi:hypothetical protein CC_3163 [Caulobacter vibrioides CB15]|uniref:DUF962 domain-containing protein n=2 Tax=Caulobacter vibrioides TaxID=155892 RepID=Q9A3N9_CAUVC|nr:hypothetical protein CC_3163 [Caulobacter vibrioides CB15]ATC29990.1 DUF962 domain-containing protein [Caulobacter vibrioides]
MTRPLRWWKRACPGAALRRDVNAFPPPSLAKLSAVFTIRRQPELDRRPQGASAGGALQALIAALPFALRPSRLSRQAKRPWTRACRRRLPATVGAGSLAAMDSAQPNTAAARYKSFAAFYPFYMTEHANPVSRRLHVVGTSLVIVCLVLGVFRDWRFFIAAPVIGYGFAWIGHFVFEKNRPATFKYPVYSLMGDFRLWFETVTGRRKF